ncbi:MAG: hypothetical protein JWM03_692 [Rhodocyclales bacterium]|nr:hypothetical protein [Rhodocyclales bacterium]
MTKVSIQADTDGSAIVELSPELLTAIGLNVGDDACGRAARQRYETLFRHEQMGEKYLAAYQDAMSG